MGDNIKMYPGVMNCGPVRQMERAQNCHLFKSGVEPFGSIIVLVGQSDGQSVHQSVSQDL
jgi:hypothetical protein